MALIMKKELELYELILLVKITSAEELSEKLEYYRNFLAVKGSQFMFKNHGKIALAYDIKGFSTASYFQIVYLGNGELTKQINKELQRDELILRTITTKLLVENVSEMVQSNL